MGRTITNVQNEYYKLLLIEFDDFSTYNMIKTKCLLFFY